MEFIFNFISDIKISYIVDILIVAFVFYKILKLIEETRAEQLVKGFVIILAFAKISEIFNLYAVNYVLSNIFTVGLIALVILFQPELRKALEHLGRSKLLNVNNENKLEEEQIVIINEIVEAVGVMSRKKTGALIVIERITGIKDIIDTGIQIDAKVSADLLMNLFYHNAPLHDGAVIIKSSRIMAAGCFLPLSDNKYISKELGTRHRAAMGMSESSDAIIVVVSEETGAISLVDKGNLQRFLDTNTVKELLADKLYRNEEKEKKEKKEKEKKSNPDKVSKFKRKRKNKNVKSEKAVDEQANVQSTDDSNLESIGLDEDDDIIVGGTYDEQDN